MNQEDQLFADLFREYSKNVLRIAYDIVRDYDTAKDICQETFFRYWRYQGEIKPGVEKRWLLAVARNLAIDYLRKGRRYETETQIEEEIERGFGRDRNLHTDLSDLIVLREERRNAINALIKLADQKPEWYEVLHLAEIEGLDNATIGAMLGIRADLVSKWKERARKMIRKACAEERGGR